MRQHPRRGRFQSGRLLAPLRTLEETAREITATDLSRRIPERGNDDITALTRTFNEMLDRRRFRPLVLSLHAVDEAAPVSERLARAGVVPDTRFGQEMQVFSKGSKKTGSEAGHSDAERSGHASAPVARSPDLGSTMVPPVCAARIAAQRCCSTMSTRLP